MRPQVRLSDVIGAMSYALDLTEGEPPGHAVRTCKIGMRLAEELELDAATRSHLFYALLLKDAGCSANSARMAALFGADDHVAKRSSKRVDWSGRLPAFAVVAAHGGAGRLAARGRVDRLLAIKAEGEVTRALMQARCDRGAEIALMLGLEPRDGGGDPRARRALGRRRPAARAARRGDPAARPDPLPRPDGGDLPRGRRRRRRRWRVARRRRGGWFDPALVDALGTIRGDARVLGLAARRRRSARGSPSDRLLDRRRRRGWTGSPTPSPASSTRSRRGPTGTPTAPA